MGAIEEKIALIIEAYNKTKGAFTELDNSLKGVSDGHKKISDDSESIFAKLKANWVAISVVVGEVGLAVREALEYMSESAKAQQAEESFKKVAAAAGESADEILASMRKAANGTMDDSAIMQKAVKGMVQGMSGDQMVNIMEASRVAARTAGVDVQTAYEQITDAIANKMPKGLRQFSLVTQEQIKLLDASMAAGIKTADLFQLVMANAADQRKKVAGDGGLVEDNEEKIQKLKALWEEVKETIGGAIWSFISGVKHAVLGAVDLVMGVMTAAVTGIMGLFLLVETGLNKIGLASDAKLKEMQGTFDKLKKGSGDFFSAAGNEFSGKDSKNPTPKNAASAPSSSKTAAEIESGMKAKLASKMREAEITKQIGDLDIAEKNRDISHVDAAEQRVRLAEQLLNTQEANLALIDKDAVGGAQAWAAQQKAIDDTKKKMSDFLLTRRDLSSDLQSGFKEGLMQYLDQVGSMFQQAVKLAEATAQAMEQAFSDFFFDIMQGKLKSLSDYITSFMLSVERAMANMMAQQTAQGIVSAITSYMAAGSGETSLPSGTMATGPNNTGIVNTPAPAAYHSGGYIPRFHAGGLNSDERMVINKVGERYITQEQNDWLTKIANSAKDKGNGDVNVAVSVVNQSGVPMNAQAGPATFDGEKYIVNVMLKAAATNPTVRNTFGVGR